MHNQLTVFDPSGRVLSRHKGREDGAFARIRVEANGVLIMERRLPDTFGFVSKELLGITGFHVWRPDPA